MHIKISLLTVLLAIAALALAVAVSIPSGETGSDVLVPRRIAKAERGSPTLNGMVKWIPKSYNQHGRVLCNLTNQPPPKKQELQQKRYTRRFARS
jgi:hypothetical protein